MEKVSNFISKNLITLDKGENAGYILNIVFDDDLNRIQGFVVANDDTDRLYLLQKEDVKAIGADYIMTSSLDKLTLFLEEEENNPIGKCVVDTAGFSLGRVIDVLVQGNIVRRIITNKCEFFRKNIRKLGKNYLIFGSKEKKQTVAPKEVFKVSSDNLPNVYIQSAKQNSGTVSKPYRILANQNSIIGRTMQSDLFGYNNEIIAKKYDIINQNIINRAKMHNKLNFLVYYSK